MKLLFFFLAYKCLALKTYCREPTQPEYSDLVRCAPNQYFECESSQVRTECPLGYCFYSYILEILS